MEDPKILGDYITMMIRAASYRCVFDQWENDENVFGQLCGAISDYRRIEEGVAACGY